MSALIWKHQDASGDGGSLYATEGTTHPLASLATTGVLYLDRDAAVALRDALDGLLGDGPRLARGEVDSRVRDVEHESFLRGFVEGQGQLVRALELADRVSPVDDAVRETRATLAEAVAERARRIVPGHAGTELGELAELVRGTAQLLADVARDPS